MFQQRNIWLRIRVCMNGIGGNVMWSQTLEILNPYKATREWVEKNYNKNRSKGLLVWITNKIRKEN